MATSDGEPETMHQPTAARPVHRSERAVSPVIGVVLMVAITIMLTAVIGGFVLGATPDGDPPPQALLGITASDDPHTVTIVHHGGDLLALEDVTVLADGAEANASLEGTLGGGGHVDVGGMPAGTLVEIAIRYDPGGDLLAQERVPVDD